jgi:hypothetical protein
MSGLQKVLWILTGLTIVVVLSSLAGPGEGETAALFIAAAVATWAFFPLFMLKKPKDPDIKGTLKPAAKPGRNPGDWRSAKTAGYLYERAVTEMDHYNYYCEGDANVWLAAACNSETDETAFVSHVEEYKKLATRLEQPSLEVIQELRRLEDVKQRSSTLIQQRLDAERVSAWALLTYQKLHNQLTQLMVEKGLEPGTVDVLRNRTTPLSLEAAREAVARCGSLPSLRSAVQ